MGDFFDEIINMRTIAKAEVEADIDGIIAEIDLVKKNLDSTQTSDQIYQSIENQKYYTDRASKYKKTKTYADTIDNYSQNKLNEYNTYENAIKNSFIYMEKNEFLDKPSEWTAEHLNKMIQGLTNDDGEQTYESVVDYFVNEQEKVGTWLADLSTIGEDGKTPMRKQFRYNKNRDLNGNMISDENVIGRISKYASQLDMGIQMLYNDGIITPEEAYLLFTGDEKMYNTKKTENKRIAEDIIKNNFKRQDGLLTLMQRVDAGASGFDINTMLNQIDDTGQMESQAGILESDTPDTIKQKLQKVMDGSNTQLAMGYSKWLAWEGSPYVGSSANLPVYTGGGKGGGTKSPYAQELLDVYTEDELNLAQTFINEGKVPDETVNMEAYKALGGDKGLVEEKKLVKEEDGSEGSPLIDDGRGEIEITDAEKYAAEEGFLDSQIADAIKAGTVLYGYSKRHKAIKAVTDRTTQVYNWFANNTSLSGKQIATILESDIVSKDLSNMRPTIEKIDKIKQELKAWREANPSVQKDALEKNKKYKKILDRLKTQETKLSQHNKKLASTIKKYLKIDVSVDDMKNILKNPEGWSINNVKKKLMNDYPKLAKEWFSTGNLGKFSRTVGGIAKGAVVFTGAEKVGHAVETGIEGAISAIVGHDVTMEDITGIEADSLLDSVAETAVGYKTVQTSSKWLIPKLIDMAKSPTGKKVLTKLIGESGVKRLMAAKLTPAAGPGKVAKLILYGVGLLSIGWDITKLVRGYREDMSDEEIDELIKEITVGKATPKQSISPFIQNFDIEGALNPGKIIS